MKFLILVACLISLVAAVEETNPAVADEIGDLVDAEHRVSRYYGGYGGRYYGGYVTGYGYAPYRYGSGLKRKGRSVETETEVNDLEDAEHKVSRYYGGYGGKYYGTGYGYTPYGYGSGHGLKRNGRSVAEEIVEDQEVAEKKHSRYYGGHRSHGGYYGGYPSGHFGGYGYPVYRYW